MQRTSSRIGKYIVGLKVVDMEGQPCDLRRSGLRNLILVVPLVIFDIVNRLSESVESALDDSNIQIYLSGLIFVALLVDVIEYFAMRSSKEQRRFGDRMAGTIVQDLKPGRSDWWFFVFTILIVIAYSLVFGYPSEGFPPPPEG